MKTRSELEENQMKRYQWEKDQMQHMKVSSTVGWGGHVIIVKTLGVESRYVTLVFNIARCMYPFTGQAPKNGKGSSV